MCVSDGNVIIYQNQRFDWHDDFIIAWHDKRIFWFSKAVPIYPPHLGLDQKLRYLIKIKHWFWMQQLLFAKSLQTLRDQLWVRILWYFWSWIAEKRPSLMARKRTITQLQRDERIFEDILTEVAIMLKLFLHFVPHFEVICSPYNRLAIL